MQQIHKTPRRTAKAVTALLCTMGVSLSYAGPREQAKRIHDRLVGVPPTAAVLDSMEAKVAANDAIGAAMEAMDNPAFYNTTVRELATPWTNRERSVYVDMNDMIATVIGMIRDDVPFDQVLYEDIVYVGTAAATPIAYSQADNDHYLDLQLNRVDSEQSGEFGEAAAIRAAQRPVRCRRDCWCHDDAWLLRGLPCRRHQSCAGSFCGAELHVHGSGRLPRYYRTP